MNRRPTHRDDYALAQRASRGERAALRELAERLRCTEGIIGSLTSRVGRLVSREDRRDLSQEVSLIVLKRIGEYRGKAKLETWIYRVCFFVAMNHVRKLRRRQRGIDDFSYQVAKSASDELPVEKIDELNSALQQLRDTEGMVVQLRHFEQLSFREIAQQSSLPVNTVRSHYYRALKRLRGKLTMS